jgi:hypothetical protein
MSTLNIKRLKSAWLLVFLIGPLIINLVKVSPAHVADFSSNLSQFKLRNGLEVIVYEDASLPVVSVVMAYGVGSITIPRTNPDCLFMHT